LLDSKVLDTHLECATVDTIAVSNQKLRLDLGADGFDNLLRGPLGVWVTHHVNVKYATLDRATAQRRRK